LAHSCFAALSPSSAHNFIPFTKPNSIMKITASSLAILLLSFSASAAAMSTLPGGERRQLHAFTTSSNTRVGGTRMLQHDATGKEPSVDDSSSMESEDDGNIQLPMSRSCITGE
jgi:hypothetical protein